MKGNLHSEANGALLENNSVDTERIRTAPANTLPTKCPGCGRARETTGDATVGIVIVDRRIGRCDPSKWTH